MSDFETRVRETLKTGSEGAPPAVGLAEAARRRWRKRRRTTAAVAATAVVIAAVPLGIAILGDGSSPGKKDNVVASNVPEIPDGWRWESWRDIQVAVPGNWENGAASQWCVSSDSRAGFVDRGEGVSTLVDCGSLGSSVSFREGVAKHPLGEVEGVGERLTIHNNTVDIVAPDQETLDEIVASAHQFDGTDSRGCAPAIQDLADPLSGEVSGELTVCRYIGSGEAYALAESRDLTEEASADWLAALAAAPDVSDSGNACDSSGGEAILVSSADGPVAFIEADACGGGYVKTADGEKAVSSDLTSPLGSQLMVIG